MTEPLTFISHNPTTAIAPTPPYFPQDAPLY